MSKTLPWVEKYRPVVLDDVVGNVEGVNRLRSIAQQGNMPHLILSGPPGTGKTSSIMCLARQMLGDAVKRAVLELNASDDRGIDVVRNKIKMFAQRKVTLPPGRQKLIILDEADSMTSSAQQALRRTMEIYSSTTRFALACNTSSKIIEAIQSRCAILRYTRLSDIDIVRRLKHVLDNEKISAWTDDGIAAVLFTAQGDMRDALNNLQATYAGTGSITQENVFKIVEQPHPQTVEKIVKECANGNIYGAIEHMRELWDQGYAAIDIIGTIFRMTKRVEMSDVLRLTFIREIAMTHMKIADGLDTLVQLTSLIGTLCTFASNQQ